jgi:hypothetical protein
VPGAAPAHALATAMREGTNLTFEG